MFTEILGRKITFRDPSTFSFILNSLQSGGAVDFTLVMALLYRATRKGMADPISDNVSKLLGRPPIAMAQYIRDYIDVWMNESSHNKLQNKNGKNGYCTYAFS
jgi:hypothetical protein